MAHHSHHVPSKISQGYVSHRHHNSTTTKSSTMEAAGRSSDQGGGEGSDGPELVGGSPEKSKKGSALELNIQILHTHVRTGTSLPGSFFARDCTICMNIVLTLCFYFSTTG